MGLARAVNCTAEGPRPCGQCRDCTRISRGLHADVRVVDKHTPIRGAADAPASTADQDSRRTVISIHHIREIQHDAALNPYEGRSHVFILDEAESLNAEAANALLKILEEPSDQVLLVLIATSASALPETVVSRCQRLGLRPAAVAEIEAGLVELAGASPEDAARLARLAQGLPGWAVAALNDPTAQDRYTQRVQRVLDAMEASLADRFHYARDLAATYRKDRGAVEEELTLWESWWRDALLIKCGLGDQIANGDWREPLAFLAEGLSLEMIGAAAEAVRTAENALSRNALPQLALEVMMLDVPRVQKIPRRVAPGNSDLGEAGAPEGGG